MTKITRALLSVSDKTDLNLIAQSLVDLGVVILSTGGTSRYLKEHGIDVVDVADVTQFPEMLDGRVKTLHPAIHAGLLARRDQDEATLNEFNIDMIDMVICNLYPFANTVAKADCSFEMAIENIDIGGPSMLRSGAKNCKDVTVVCDPRDYAGIIDELKQNQGSTTFETRKRLAAKVFSHVATYNQQIATYLGAGESLRYGENPQQQAQLFRCDNAPGTLAHAHQHQGKALSFNNLMDTDTAYRCTLALDETIPACTIVKHATPCGVGADLDQTRAYEKAFMCDSTSAFGGIIAFNSTLNAKTAQAIVDKQFAEVIIAPSVDEDALSILAQKKNLRVLSTGTCQDQQKAQSHHSISGGLLIQDVDPVIITQNDLRVVTEVQPTQAQIDDALFAWQVVKYVKSNAIVYAKDQMTLGIGSGQTSRVFSAEIALLKAKQAGLDVKGSAMASDAFFPFADGIEVAINAGINTIIQPGGSIRDQDVIDAANKHGIAMLFTGTRHFRH